MRLHLPAVALAVALVVTGCSGDDDPAASGSTSTETTTTVATTTTAGGSTESSAPTTDRPPPATAPEGTSSFDEATCDLLIEAIGAFTLPVRGDGDRAAQLDDAEAALDAAAAAAGGYPAEVLATLSTALTDSREDIVDGGFAAWQEVLLESRSLPEEEDLEAQLEALRLYVLPRC